jgi:hypothetical protein
MFFIVASCRRYRRRLVNAPLLAVLLLIDGPALDQPPGSVAIGLQRPSRAHDGSADNWYVRFVMAKDAIATRLRKAKEFGKSKYVDG